MEGEEREMPLACVIAWTLFMVFCSESFSILWDVNWRPWSIYSRIFAKKWLAIPQGSNLDRLCDFLSLFTWIIVISPVLVLTSCGCWLIVILGRDLIGLAVIMAGSTLLLAFYSIML